MHFSVIIPARNEEHQIGRCLASVIQADREGEVEVVVVDNGSIDATVRIAREMGATVYVQPGLNVGGLRNYGAARTKGEILAFIDADCAVARSWFKEAAKYLAKGEVVCFGSPPRIPERSTWVQRAWYQVRRKEAPVGETQWLESMNMFVRRDAFLACGGFDDGLVTCEDYDLSLRLRSCGRLVADSGVEAVHFGEAATVGHFFRKEYWRGIGNLKGALSHGITLAEAPSLCLPVLHCLLFVALCATLLLGGRLHPALASAAVLSFAGWQSLLFFCAVAKYFRRAPAHVVQIFVLLNVYYLARGLAILRHP